jgi:hypothetical protein
MDPKIFGFFIIAILVFISLFFLYKRLPMEPKIKEKKKEDEDVCTNPAHSEMYLDEGRYIVEWRCATCGKKVRDA